MFSEVMSTCRKAGFLPKAILEFEEMSSVILAVESGLGVSLSLGFVRGMLTRDSVVRQIKPASSKIPLCAVWAAGPQEPVVKSFVEVLRAGGKIAVSGHNTPAIRTHFEIWAFQRGGATPGEAIRAATMTGAEKLGIQEDIGSLAPGKIADFLVLTSNPLDKIENSLDLAYTVADGIIYDSTTLDIVWPREKSGGMDKAQAASRAPAGVSINSVGTSGVPNRK